MRLRRLTLAIALATGLLSLSAIGAGAGAGKTAFTQTNLVSNRTDQGASVIDPSLQNPWGISAGPSTPMWVSDNGAGVTTLYRGDGSKVPLTVVIPPGAGSGEAQGTPTGTVFNGNGAAFRGDRFLFATEDGTLAGWQMAFGVVARTEVDNSLPPPGAVYKGLAIGSTAAGDRLYAANFRGGAVDVFDSNFSPAGSFTDPKIPANYAPFNVQNLGGVLYVTFAMRDATGHDDIAGQGHGFVDAFDTNGNLLRRLVSHGRLDSPWGLAIAPASFGDFAGDLLVGNFGDGRINAYTVDKGNFRGVLTGTNGAPITIDGLWALRVGNTAADPNAVYFTAGINNEADGLFGKITNAQS
ncbi:MAG: TIGR03118 family protein [Chloroflexi bacterium]|nr:MAG: TIGR03118 family protein [Chloroflexota bacterium]